MSTIQWRPAVNALTVPQSYKMLFVPRNTVGYSELAAEIAAENPNWNAELVEAVMRAERKAIQRHLINGDQITLEDAFSYRVSFVGKLDAPDAPLPDRDDLLQVNIHASAPFMRELRHAAQLERLAPEQKQPLIAAAEDTKLKLKDVLNPNGVLRLSGANLFFEEGAEGCGCVIEGTRSGERAVQSQFAQIANSSVLLVPDIPAQAHPWNNEYTLSISTQYTEHGTLRSGIYGRKLRSPLTLTNFGHPNPPETGIQRGQYLCHRDRRQRERGRNDADSGGLGYSRRPSALQPARHGRKRQGRRGSDGDSEWDAHRAGLCWLGGQQLGAAGE